MHSIARYKREGGRSVRVSFASLTGLEAAGRQLEFKVHAELAALLHSSLSLCPFPPFEISSSEVRVTES